MTYNVKTGNAAINAAISAAVSSQKEFQENIQKAINLIVTHTVETGDCSAFGRLLNRLHRNTAKVSLITRYVGHFTSIRVGPDPKNKGKVKAFLKRDDNGNAIPVLAEQASRMRSTKWWKHEPEPDVSTIFTVEDVETRVKNVVSFMDRLLKGEAKNGTLKPEDKSKVREMMDRINAAIKGERVAAPEETSGAIPVGSAEAA